MMRRIPAIGIVLLASLVSAGSAPAGESRCRCAQLSFDRYWHDAEIVLVARVTAVRAVTGPDGANRVAIDVRPEFRQGRPFKGSLDGITLVTPDNSASCGVPVEAGATYILFASVDSGEGGIAWFHTCNGSRQYPDAAHREIEMGFLDVPDNRVVPRLFELADQGTAQTPSTTEFHTSPACWSDVRIAHQGNPPVELRDRIRLTRETARTHDVEGQTSPNGAYRAYSLIREVAPPGDRGATVFVDVERDRQLRIDLEGATQAPDPQWVSEKLLFLRVAWGRVQFTDVLLDVEQGTVIYEEAARYAQEAFEQYTQACAGQCPCAVVPGSVDTLPEPPRHRPAPGQETVATILDQRPLAYLDADWDGRMFTEAGGRVFTVSALKDTSGREEYPVDILDMTEIAGTRWLRVAVFTVSRCNDANAEPAHAGWVPAFSVTGQFVIGTWPGGC